MTKTHIIFDLDGTLIDSSPSILAGFAYALEQMHVKPIRPLTSEVIGPPLFQTLANLTGSQDIQLLQALAEHFKAHYDTEGYKETVVFDGMSTMLQSLVAAGKQLYIATNKRLNPTIKIMQYLGWTEYFKGIYALDYFQPAVASKQEMIGRILDKHGLSLADSLYVGDRFEDGMSAEGNGLEFAMVTWGYLDETSGNPPAHWLVYDSPQSLSQAIIASV